MPSIYTRKRGNKWQYQIYFTHEDGQQKTVTKSGFISKRQAMNAAEDAIRQYEQALNENPFSPAIDPSAADSVPDSLVPVRNIPLNIKPITYLDFLEQWMREYCSVNLKETTVHGYMKKINYIIAPVLGQYPIQELTPLILQNFINLAFNQGYARNQLATIKGILTGSLRYAVTTAGLLARNPARDISLPHIRAKPQTPPRTKQREPITKEQWNQLMDRFPREHPSHIPLNLGYQLGLRLGEAFGLCWQDIDFEAKTVSIIRQVQYDEDLDSWYFTDPKYDSKRTITVGEALLDLLANERRHQQFSREYYGDRYQQICVDETDHLGEIGSPVHLVCVRANGTYIHPRTLLNTYRVAHCELKMPLFDFHTLRHTHATMLLDAGASLLDVKERLGHTKIEITNLYTHNTDAARSRTLDVLNKLY